MNSDQTVTINDNLIQIDNLVTALNYLYEDVKTRSDEIKKNIGDEKLMEILKNLVYNDRNFRYRFTLFIRDEYSSDLVKNVAFSVMEKIDEDIDAFINSRVEAKLKELGVIQ